MAPHSSSLAWKVPWVEEPGGLVHGVPKSWTQLSDFTFTFHFHALEKEMATHCSVLAWRIPGTREPGGLWSVGSHRVGYDWSDLAAEENNPQTKPDSRPLAWLSRPREASGKFSLKPILRNKSHDRKATCSSGQTYFQNKLSSLCLTKMGVNKNYVPLARAAMKDFRGSSVSQDNLYLAPYFSWGPLYKRLFQFLYSSVYLPILKQPPVSQTYFPFPLIKCHSI